MVVDRIDEGGIELVGEFQAHARGWRWTASCWSRSGSPTTRCTASWRPTRPRSRAAGIEAVYRIGDCVAPRLIADAIFDGHRLAREIDSPDPARPLPYLRERPLMAGTPAG